MFKGHPMGLFIASLANMGERFGFYTMVAIFTLFIQANMVSMQKKPAAFMGFFLQWFIFCLCWVVI